MSHSRTRFIVIALSIILCLFSLVHFIIYEALVISFSLSNFYLLLALRIVFVALTVSFILASIISMKYNNFFTRGLYRFSATWTGFSFYVFLAAILYILYLLLGPPSTVLALILFTAALLIGIYGVVHSNNIKVTHLTLELPHLPASWKERTAVFLSDLHLGQVRGRRFSEKVAAEIKKINPDIVFIAGDVYDGAAVREREVVEPLKSLVPLLGIYFVTGNHEEFGDNSKYLEALRGVGIKILNDEKIEIDSLQILGVDYKTTNTAEKFKTVLDSISLNPLKPSILIKHVPLHVDVAAQKGISLQLSGHTHKAQVFPFTLLTSRMFKGFDYGLKKLGALSVVTSSGVGTWGPPLRIGTDSEIIVIAFA